MSTIAHPVGRSARAGAKRRLGTIALFLVLAAIDALGAFFMATGKFVTTGEVLLIAAAAAIGVAAAFAFARAADTRSGGALAVWLARGFGLVSAAIAVWFPAILFGEMRNYQTGAYTPIEVVRGEIQAAAFGLVYGLIPIVIALRFPVAGGWLFVANAAVGFVLGAFDPFGSFPERAVVPSIIGNTVPPLALGLALILGGLAMRRRPGEPTFAVWLRALLRPID